MTIPYPLIFPQERALRTVGVASNFYWSFRSAPRALQLRLRGDSLQPSNASLQRIRLICESTHTFRDTYSNPSCSDIVRFWYRARSAQPVVSNGVN